MSIKMICSDLDGTLLTYYQTEMTERFFNLVRELHKRGILFVPASGRQIVSMQKLYDPVKECCKYLCSNGAVLCDGEGNVFEKLVMPKEVALAIARDFMDRCDGRGEVNIAGARVCHLWSRNLGMEERLRYIGNEYEIITDPEQVQDEIVKVSLFLPEGAARYLDRFEEKWKDYNPAIAGPFWIDTMLANKGIGVKSMCRHLGIDLSEVVAFGDNYNDVDMLDLVGKPYIMSSAADELLARYENHTDSVEDTLEQILTGEV